METKMHVRLVKHKWVIATTYDLPVINKWVIASTILVYSYSIIINHVNLRYTFKFFQDHNIRPKIPSPNEVVLRETNIWEI